MHVHEPELLVYLSGEVHSDWRTELQSLAEDREVRLRFAAPITDHPASDACGAATLGPEDSSFWHDHKGAKLNAIRARVLMGRADVVVVRFGEQYRQWNAAFDAGWALASGIPLITLHDASLDHALKEVDAGALAVARTPREVIDALRYVTSGDLPDGWRS
ncbi:MAG: YtoQ family protein [Planctomycetota bacterium]|nr:YtoQ family protein [Planctomycetota bacterium]